MLNIKPFVIRMFVFFMCFYLLNKFWFRSFIFEHETFGLMRVFTLSVPNFIEAVMGTLVITGNLLLLQQKTDWLSKCSERSIQLIAVTLAGAYVITQELKIHNLGGRNTYDPNDVIASALGLVFILVVLRVFGFRQSTSFAGQKV